MSTALLVEYFNELPQPQPEDHPKEWRIRRQAANEAFRKRVAERYLEGTLLRLLDSQEPATRQAALLALGMIGTLDNCNARLARCLHDNDTESRQYAVDALWALWFRADTEENNKALKKLSQTRDREKAQAGLTQLIERSPQFAEAYNQRAIVRFRLQRYEDSILDCQKTLTLNPFHFGAQAGMGQCFLQLRKPRAALKAFRRALEIHPHLDGVAETVRKLERALGEGRSDDKK